MLALDGNPPGPEPAARSRSGGAGPGITRLLQTARVTLGADVAFVTSVDGVNQTFTHVAGAAASFGWQPGTQIPESDGYCHYVLAGELPNVVPDARHDPLAAVLPATDAAGIGSYVGVPLHLGDGRVYGALCVASHDPRTDLGGADVLFMRFLARLIADEIGQQERDDLADDAVRQELAGWLVPGALDIHLQPIVEIAGGQVRGFEALTRFPGRPGSPAEVFAAAATVGVGVALELSAIRTALTLLPRLPVGTYLSVNASPATIQDDGLARLLRTVPAERVLIEVTEHTAIDDHPYFRSHLRKLRRTGARIAMDDTGSGYAGLQTLLSLEPDVIKLDIALVRNVHQDPGRRALIRALVGFAGESGSVLIAEGIETSRDLAALARLGVPLGQGYVIAAPAPLAELLPPPHGEGDDAAIRVWPSRKLDMSDVRRRR